MEFSWYLSFLTFLYFRVPGVPVVYYLVFYIHSFIYICCGMKSSFAMAPLCHTPHFLLKSTETLNISSLPFQSSGYILLQACYQCPEWEFSPQPDPALGREFSLSLRLSIPRPSFIPSLVLGSGSSPPSIHILQIFASGLFCPESLLDSAELWSWSWAFLLGGCSSCWTFLLTELVRGVVLSADGLHVPLQMVLAEWAPCKVALWHRICWKVSPDEEELGDYAAVWVSPICAWWTHILLDLVFMGQLYFQSGAGIKPITVCVLTLGGWVIKN